MQHQKPKSSRSAEVVYTLTPKRCDENWVLYTIFLHSFPVNYPVWPLQVSIAIK